MLDTLQTLNLLNLLSAGHIGGLVMGFGAVVCLDLVLVHGYLTNQTTNSEIALCQIIARLVCIGLYALWLSGLSLLFYYFIHSPEKLQSSVLHAKLIVVILLTINSMIVNRKALPIVWKYRARNVLANADTRETFLLAICIAISFVSWCFPLFLALLPALGEQQSVAQLLSHYFLALIVVVPFSCAVALRARLNIKATSLLTYHGRALTSQR